MTGHAARIDTTAAGRSRAPFVAPCGVLLLIVFVAYAPTLSSDFVLFDDPQYVFENPLILNPSWSGVWRFLTEVQKPSTVAGYYQPLTMLSLMLDRLVSGGEGVQPMVCHFHNIALHGVMSLLVMLLLRELGASSTVAFLLAALFALHPANVESVAWISQRKTVLASPLAVGCLLGHLRFLRTGRRSWHFVAVSLYCLATLAKPTIVLLPLVLPLMRWMLDNRQAPMRDAAYGRLLHAAGRSLPYAVVMCVMSVVAAVSQARSQATLGVPNLASFEVLSKWLALLAYNLMLYLGNVVWPMHLAPFRSVPESLSWTSPPILGSFLGLAAFIGLLVRTFLRARPLFAALAAFCLMLAPAMGPVRFFDSCVADRFLYVPMVFLCAAAARPLTRWTSGSARASRLTGLTVLAFGVPLWVLTQAQQSIWRDGKTFWTHVVETVPEYGIGHVMRGLVALEERDVAGLFQHAHRAAEILPDDAQAVALWGRANLLRGDAVEAERVLREALRRGPTPDASAVHIALAETLATQGRLEEARQACKAAIESGATPLETYLHVGEILLTWTRRYDFAAECFQKVVEVDPTNRQAQWNLGTAREGMGDPSKALAAYEKALAGYEERAIPPALREAVARLRRQVQPAQATTAPGAQKP